MVSRRMDRQWRRYYRPELFAACDDLWATPWSAATPRRPGFGCGYAAREQGSPASAGCTRPRFLRGLAIWHSGVNCQPAPQPSLRLHPSDLIYDKNASLRHAGPWLLPPSGSAVKQDRLRSVSARQPTKPSHTTRRNASGKFVSRGGWLGLFQNRGHRQWPAVVATYQPRLSRMSIN